LTPGFIGWCAIFYWPGVRELTVLPEASVRSAIRRDALSGCGGTDDLYPKPSPSIRISSRNEIVHQAKRRRFVECSAFVFDLRVSRIKENFWKRTGPRSDRSRVCGRVECAFLFEMSFKKDRSFLNDKHQNLCARTKELLVQYSAEGTPEAKHGS
jgi:hypothetical protein